MKNMDKNAAEGNSVPGDLSKVGVGLNLGSGGGSSKMGSSQVPVGASSSGLGGGGAGGGSGSSVGAGGVNSAASAGVHDPASLLDAASLFGELLAFTERKISFASIFRTLLDSCSLSSRFG